MCDGHYKLMCKMAICRSQSWTMKMRCQASVSNSARHHRVTSNLEWSAWSLRVTWHRHHVIISPAASQAATFWTDCRQLIRPLMMLNSSELQWSKRHEITVWTSIWIAISNSDLAIAAAVGNRHHDRQWLPLANITTDCQLPLQDVESLLNLDVW